MIKIILLFLFSCAKGPISSGHYIRLNYGEGLNDVAKRYKLNPLLLLNSNKGIKWKRGDYVFIPNKVGILGNRDFFQKDYPNDEEVLKQYFSRKFLWPVPGYKDISSSYGKRRGKFHSGIDIPARKGTKFVSSDDGLVIFASKGISGYGKMIVVAHPKKLFTVYAHADKILVSKGTRVYKGQYIGLVGSTGRSTGPHLHFEIRKSSKVLDPQHFFTSL